MTGDNYGLSTGGGSITIHGGNQAIGAGARIRAASGSTAAPTAVAATGTEQPDPERSRNVFVVYGRDEQVRSDMFRLLRSLGLWPHEWEHLVKATGEASPSLLRTVRHATTITQAALVLLTPDDMVMLHPALCDENESPWEAQRACQARPNVLLELGLALMAYPERTIILEIGALRPISDIQGLNFIRFDGSPRAVGKLVERLKSAGCRVNDVGSDWRDNESLNTWDAHTRGR